MFKLNNRANALLPWHDILVLLVLCFIFWPLFSFYHYPLIYTPKQPQAKLTIKLARKCLSNDLGPPSILILDMYISVKNEVCAQVYSRGANFFWMAPLITPYTWLDETKACAGGVYELGGRLLPPYTWVG